MDIAPSYSTWWPSNGCPLTGTQETIVVTRAEIAALRQKREYYQCWPSEELVFVERAIRLKEAALAYAERRERKARED